MQSLKETAAREYIKQQLFFDFRSVVKLAQEHMQAYRVADVIWAAPLSQHVQDLDNVSVNFLLQGSGINENHKKWIAKSLQCGLNSAFESDNATTRQLIGNNPHLRGKRLGRACRYVVDREWDDIRRNFDRLAESENSDLFADRVRVRDLVIQRLNSLMFDELLSGSMNESNRKLRLKILAIVAWRQECSMLRSERISGLGTGRIAELPFVPKYISRSIRQTTPKVPLHARVSPQQVFNDDMLAKFQEANPIKECVDRFLRREGMFTIFSSPDREVTEENVGAYAELGTFVRHNSGLIITPGVALYNHRRDVGRMPEGIVALVGMSSLLESFLRQILYSHQQPLNRNHRGNKLVSLVQEQIALSEATQNLLTWIFGTSNESGRRDSFAHAVFLAGDQELIEGELQALVAALKLLQDDLEPGVRGQIYQCEHWNQAPPIPQEELDVFNRQANEAHLFAHRGIEDARKHVFQVLKKFIPDKAKLGMSAILFWSDLDGNNSQLDGVVGAHYSAIVGAMLVLEELLRALNEEMNEPILNVHDHMFQRGDEEERGFKCEFAFLDDNVGQLLEDARMLRVLPEYWSIDEFRNCTRIVRGVRDRIFHGGWHLLPDPKPRYLHLAVKLIFAICSKLSI